MKESFRHFEHNKTVDLIGLGNAIVDIIVNIEDKFLEKNNLDKGSMNLINSKKLSRCLSTQNESDKERIIFVLDCFAI